MIAVTQPEILWRAPTSAPEVSGALVVGVGAADLDLRSNGLHHLVEHLVMNRVGHLPCTYNAVSTSAYVAFFASGTPDHVLTFLTSVLAAITSLRAGLTHRELEQEKNILAIEFAGRGGGRMSPWTVRYGVRGVGLLDQLELGVGSATVEGVHAFMDQWFVADNTRLVLNFDPGTAITMDLPTGTERRRVRWQAPAESARRGYAVTETDGVTLSFDGTEARGDALVFEVLQLALRRELRHQHGLVYSVDAAACVTGTGRRVTLFSLDPVPEDVDATVYAALTVVGQVATGGLPRKMLEEARQSVLAHLGTAAGLLDELASAAVRDLCGDPPEDRAETVRVIEQMTIADVCDRVSELAQTLVVTIPHGAAVHQLALGALVRHRLPLLELFDTDLRPIAEVAADLLKFRGFDSSREQVRFRPTRGYYPKVFGPVRGVNLWIGPGRLVVVTRGEPPVFVDARDVILMETCDDGSYFLLTRRGCRVSVNPRHFRGALRWWPHFAQELPGDILGS